MGKGGLGAKGGKAPGGKPEAPVEKHVFTEERVKGYISQWQSTWGWVVPQQKIENPQGKFLNTAPNPRIYFHINDARSGSPKAEGDEISFFLYKDERGIGAADVTLKSEDEAEGGEEMAEEAVAEEAGEEGAEGEEAQEEAQVEEEWAPEAEDAGTWGGSALAKSTPKMAAAPPKASIMPKAKATVMPKAKAATIQPKAAVAAVAPPATSFPSFTSTRIGSKRRFRGKVNKWSGVFGWITPTDTLPEDLKSALMRFNAGIYTSWRHLQQGIKPEAGIAVDFTVESDENGLVALDVGITMKAGVNNDPFAEVQKALGGSIGSLKAELERTALLEKKKAEAAAEPMEEEQQEEEQQEGAYEKEAEAEEEQAYAEEESWEAPQASQETSGEEEAPLPPGWEAIWSNEHECFYFWHKVSKTPAWERPTAPIAVSPTPPKAAGKAGAKGIVGVKGVVGAWDNTEAGGKAGAKGAWDKGKAGKMKAAFQQAQEESYEAEAEAEEEAEEPQPQVIKRKGAPGKGDAKNEAWKGGGKKQKSWN